MVDSASAEPGNGVSIGTLTGLSRVVFYSLLCGATSLIPVPFLDDWIFAIVRRFMTRDLMAKAGYRLTTAQVRILSRMPARWQDRGCLASLGYYVLVAPLKAVVYIIKKLFRKIVFILTLKEASDRSLESFHEAYLIVYGANRAEVLPGMMDDIFVEGLREAIQETLRETDTSALSHVFGTVVKLNQKTLSKAGTLLMATWHRLKSRTTVEVEGGGVGTIRDEEGLLEEMTRKTTEKIVGQKKYLDALEQRFDGHFRDRGVRRPVRVV